MLNITWTDTTNNLTFSLGPNDISTIEGFEYPSVRGVVEDISGEKSSIFITSKFGRRPLSVIGFKKPQTYQARIDMLGVFRQDGKLRLMEFTTQDGKLLQTEVLVQKILYPYDQVKKPFLIEMVAPDWRFYDQTETVEQSSEMNQEINNEGNEITCPTFRIYGPFTDVQITNLSTGEEFSIIESVAEGEYVEVDVMNKTVMLTDDYGETSIFSAFSGEFFCLIPGINLINYLVNGDGASTTLRTTFRNAYLGV
jgi:hypothetical protein